MRCETCGYFFLYTKKKDEALCFILNYIHVCDITLAIFFYQKGYCAFDVRLFHMSSTILICSGQWFPIEVCPSEVCMFPPIESKL